MFWFSCCHNLKLNCVTRFCVFVSAVWKKADKRFALPNLPNKLTKATFTDKIKLVKMPELGPMMRALELQRIIEDKVTEWRERSARVAGASVADSYQQPLNFKRHTHRRKNSAEINRIIAKYSRHNKRAHDNSAKRIIPETPPTRPPRAKKLSYSKALSKSEDNLASMGDVHYNPNPADDKPGFSGSKYSARSCEDVTAFVDIHHSMTSKNFDQTSILNAKLAPRNPRSKLHSISEDLTVKPTLVDSGLDLRQTQSKSDFVTSTPLSKRKTCPSESSVFEKCKNYSSVSDLRKGSSEPDILSVSSIHTTDTAKTLDSKKKWKLLKPPFRKGALDCLFLWRGKKTEQRQTESTTR